MSCDDTTWLKARLAKTEELIIKYEDAVAAIEAGVLQYSLDTGQTRQSVTKRDLTQLKNALISLENRREHYRAKLGCGSTHMRPAY